MTISALLVCYSCDNQKDESVELSYEKKKNEIRISTESYYENSTEFRNNLKSLIHSENNAESFNLIYDDFRKIYPDFSSGNFEEFALDIENAKLTNNLHQKSETLTKRIELAFKETVSASEARLSSRDGEEEVSIDSIYSYFNELKIRLKSQISEDERWIDAEESLTEEEKLALYAAYLNILELTDGIVDESLEYLLAGGSFEAGKDIKSRFFKKLGNWLKRAANSIATVVKYAVEYAIPGAVIGLGASLIGATYGAILGAGHGVLRGLSCLGKKKSPCVVCVFCQSNPKKSCYCP